MAKEGFDWIWCQHVLTVGYRASLTEIVQIIGRATRDAKGKTYARFTNLIAEPDADQEDVADAVNDTLKAIAASLLMEQVLTPKFNFVPKNAESKPTPGFDYGENDYDTETTNIGFDKENDVFEVEIKGLVEPKSLEAQRICKEDLNEVVAAFVQDQPALERGIFDQEETIPEELTQVRMGKIVREKYPDLEEGDREAIRQRAVAALTMTQEVKKNTNALQEHSREGNTALIDGVRRFAMNVRDLNVDLIDGINPFREAYAILAKSMSEKSLIRFAEVVAAKRINLSAEEARELAKRALRFKMERGRLPSLTAQDPWEKKMAEGIAFLNRLRKEAENG